jgi:hypothetical protein
MEKITYSIVSRGHMIIHYGSKSVKITGELIFDPPTFYADINAFKNWDLPNFKKITEEEKKILIDFITEDGSKDGKTKIIFD